MVLHQKRSATIMGWWDRIGMLLHRYYSPVNKGKAINGVTPTIKYANVTANHHVQMTFFHNAMINLLDTQLVLEDLYEKGQWAKAYKYSTLIHIKE